VCTRRCGGGTRVAAADPEWNSTKTHISTGASADGNRPFFVERLQQRALCILLKYCKTYGNDRVWKYERYVYFGCMWCVPTLRVIYRALRVPAAYTTLPQSSTASLFLSDGGRSNYARGLSPSRRAPDVYRVYGNLSPDPITLVRASRTLSFIHTRSS